MKKKSALKKWLTGILIGAVIHAIVFIGPIVLMMTLFFGVFSTVLNTEDVKEYTNIDVYEDEGGWYKADRQGNSSYFVSGDALNK